jgi:hypothetical protein
MARSISKEKAVERIFAACDRSSNNYADYSNNQKLYLNLQLLNATTKKSRNRCIYWTRLGQKTEKILIRIFTTNKPTKFDHDKTRSASKRSNKA